MLSQTLTTKFDYLVQKNLISRKEVNDILKRTGDKDEAIIEQLKKVHKISAKDILKSFSVYHDCPFIDYDSKIVIDKSLLSGLNLSYLYKNLWIPLRRHNGTIEVLVDNPNDAYKLDDIKSFINYSNVCFIGAFPEVIIKYLDQVTKAIKGLPPQINDLQIELDSQFKEGEAEEDTIDESDNSIITLSNKIIYDAYNIGASDIHIEPNKKGQPTIVRYRVDGDCMKAMEIPYKYKNAIVSRFKIIAGLNIAQRRLPQSGKINFRLRDRDLELRVEVTPTVGRNEDLVLRILGLFEPKPLDQINLNEYNQKNFLEILARPYGLVLVVGPTGSGKTTTLHSALMHMNRPEKKIWTAEDPVEITQPGLRQVQVQYSIDLSFANCLRSFLRADPDVIMIGEMRDKETATIAIEASLTGHLVFSTLHTNTAPDTIVRLIDMGIDAYNIGNALLGILAQRLVKTLCQHCKTLYQPTEDEYEELVHEYGLELFKKRMGVEYNRDLQLYKPVGCEKCGNTGYKGRTAIHELLVVDKEIKRMIIRGAEIDLIRDKAIENGMTTLKQDGIMKVFKGESDLLQVRKVCI